MVALTGCGGAVWCDHRPVCRQVDIDLKTLADVALPWYDLHRYHAIVGDPRRGPLLCLDFGRVDAVAWRRVEQFELRYLQAPALPVQTLCLDGRIVHVRQDAGTVLVDFIDRRGRRWQGRTVYSYQKRTRLIRYHRPRGRSKLGREIVELNRLTAVMDALAAAGTPIYGTP